MPFPKPWTDPAHVGDFFNFLPFGLSSLGCTMDERESEAEYFAPRAGVQRTVIFLHATRRRKKEREGEEKKKKKLPMPNQWQDEVISLPLGFLPAAWRTSPGKATSTPAHSRAQHSGSNKSADARVQPASASCSWGAVTSQIPASLFIPFCSGSQTPAVVTPALAGPAPGARGGPAGGGGGAGRRRRRRVLPAGSAGAARRFAGPRATAADRRVRSPNVTRF